MKKTIILSLVLLFCKSYTLHAQQNEWENPTVYEWNKEKAHTDLMLYKTKEDAQKELEESKEENYR